MELVWENSVSQTPVIGACGDINTHGEFMGSFVAAFKEEFYEFHHEVLRARLPAAVGPGQAGRRRVFSWVTRLPCVEGGSLKQLRRPAFLSRCAAWFLRTSRYSSAVSVSWGHRHKYQLLTAPQSWRLKPRTRCGQGWFPLRPLSSACGWPCPPGVLT